MRPLLIVAGPTAVGKSAIAVELAKKLNGSIISCDSMQIYRGMDIGSAKIRPEEMQGVPHYLLDVADPKELFDVTCFQKLAKEAIDQIYQDKKLPILCGGTGFYIQAILYDIDFTAQETDPGYREECRLFAEKEGAEALHEKLRAVDPKAADAIPFQNVKRVIRALEFYRQSGGLRISDHNEKERAKSPAYDACFFALTEPREILYDRIEKRVDQMMEQGLLQEVEGFYRQGFGSSDRSMQGLGYRELLQHFEGAMSLDTAVSLIKRNSRHYAKRQLTWLRREPSVIWIDRAGFHESQEEILAFMVEKWTEKQTPYKVE